LPRSRGQLTQSSCGDCSSTFDSRFVLVWHDQLSHNQ
jgi:hypothetical protein